MSKGPAAIPLFGDAYLADTTHLSCEEHGAYLLLMMAAWRQDDCALPHDDKKLARITGLSTKKWASIKPTIMEFWTEENGRIYQGRLRKEHEWVAQKSAHNRSAAEARWNKQGAENKETELCDRNSVGNAPPPPPPPKVEEEDIAPSGACPSAIAEAPDLLIFGFGELRVAALAILAVWFRSAAKQIDDAMLKPEHVRDHWNNVAKRINRPEIRLLSPERRKLVKARIGAHPLEDFHDLFDNVEGSEFLRGEKTWSGVTFDWLMQKKNFLKVLEGNYNG